VTYGETRCVNLLDIHDGDNDGCTQSDTIDDKCHSGSISSLYFICHCDKRMYYFTRTIFGISLLCLGE